MYSVLGLFGHPVDFRRLNAVTKLLAVPLPLIDDILALLGRSTCFSILDLRSGYWQVSLKKRDREKAAFNLSCRAISF